MYLKVALHEKKLMMRLFPGDDSFRTPLLKCCNSNNYKYSFANIYYKFTSRVGVLFWELFGMRSFVSR